MKKVLLLLLSTLMALAIEFPQTITSSITSVDKSHITVQQAIPKGMSGIVIHDYGNNVSAITHTLIGQGGNLATLQTYNAIEHNNLPNIKSPATVGDKVVFGNFYDNALLLAPNEKTYSTITSSIKRNWVHPDIFALHLIANDEAQLSMQNIKEFALENQIGLIAIVTQKGLRILDPLSQHYLLEHPITETSGEAMTPFYARFEQISNSFWGGENVKQSFTEYYKGVENIQ